MRCIFSPDEAHFDRTGVPGNSLSYCFKNSWNMVVRHFG